LGEWGDNCEYGGGCFGQLCDGWSFRDVVAFKIQSPAPRGIWMIWEKSQQGSGEKEKIEAKSGLNLIFKSDSQD
jgi:hypothetical protein